MKLFGPKNEGPWTIDTRSTPRLFGGELHLLCPDTNVLWTDNKKIMVAPEFEEFWEHYALSHDLRLVLPEPVKQELLFQQTSAALKHLSKINAGLSAAGRIAGQSYGQANVTPERVRDDVEVRLDAWLTKKGAVWELPTEKIDWGRVATDALWRRPPFQEGPSRKSPEKGFRDALILETVVDLANEARSGGAPLAFISKDQLLRSTTESRLESYPNVTVYGSLAEYAAVLDNLDALSEPRMRELRSRAARLFFERGRRGTLLHSKDLGNRIGDEFAAHARESLPSEDYQWPIRALLEVIETYFRGIKGERYLWTTLVRVSCPDHDLDAFVLRRGALRVAEIEVLWSSGVDLSAETGSHSIDHIQLLQTRAVSTGRSASHWEKDLTHTVGLNPNATTILLRKPPSPSADEEQRLTELINGLSAEEVNTLITIHRKLGEARRREAADSGSEEE